MRIKYSTIIVKDMEESVKFYTDVLGFEVDEVFNLPQATITLLNCDGEAGVELIKNEVNEVGIYSVGMDVEDINLEIKNLKSKGIQLVMEPTKISVGTMALIKDPNEVNIVLIQHDN